MGYRLSGEAKDLPELLYRLSRVFDPIDLPPDRARQERAVILREYERRVARSPGAMVMQAMDAFLYEGNAAAHSVMGTPDEIEALDPDRARALHAATHRPGNARLVVIGDVTRQHVRRALRDIGWPDPSEDGFAAIAPPPFELAEPDTRTFPRPDRNVAPRLIWRRVVALDVPVQFDLLEAQTALLRDILYTNLPGGLAGPLRFDARIARSFDLRIRPLDEDDIEIEFIAAPDRGVTLAALRAAFESALAEVSVTGIPETTYSRVFKRFRGFWPDWTDAEETEGWMARYVLDRVSALRVPLSKAELRQIGGALSIETANMLLRHLAGEGRTAVAFLGPMERFK